ncbi:unnamed protein product, partial [Prorocentrum cordatum]
MECMEGGELFDRVTERKIFSEKDAASTTNQMLLAVNYLHGRGVVHRDLKLENLIGMGTLGKDADFLKLIDFGPLCCMLHVSTPSIAQASGDYILVFRHFARPRSALSLC